MSITWDWQIHERRQSLQEELRYPSALSVVRSMRGGSQGKLMHCDDGKYWVIKFVNNPQHRRVLINEWIATNIAKSIGLNVPKCQMIEVEHKLITEDPLLRIELPRGKQQHCAPGLQFGSLFTLEGDDRLVEYLPPEAFLRVTNIAEFVGMLCLDKWTSNEDGRQVVYAQHSNGNYRAIFIDQGFCFGAGEWVFRDSPIKGIFGHNIVYRQVDGWSSFEPWLCRIESIEIEMLHSIIEQIPLSWFENDQPQLANMVTRLLLRKNRLKDLITEFRISSRHPFPNWLY